MIDAEFLATSYVAEPVSADILRQLHIAKFDPNQPRDEKGRWSTTPGLMKEDDYLKSKGIVQPTNPDDTDGWDAYFKNKREHSNAWKRSMQRAISTSQISEEDANKQFGYYSEARAHGGYKDLPDTLWHVTTGLSNIEKVGFKTREELGGRTTLGGGSSDTISFTDNPEMAKQYLEGIKLARRVMRGDVTVEDLFMEAERDGFANDLRDIYRRESSHTRQGEPSRIADILDGTMVWEIPDAFKGRDEKAIRSMMGLVGAGKYAQTARIENGYMIHDLDPAQRMDQKSEFFKRWLFFREKRTGKVDPVFFSNNWDHLISTDPEDIALVEVKVKPKSKGYYLPAEHEWRINFGDLVDLKRVVAKIEKAEERLLKPFQTFASEGRGLLQLVSQLHTSRLSAFGFCAEAEVMEVQDYQITEQLDNRICPVCEMMHGKVFRVDAARNALISIITEKNPDNLRSMQPWPKQTKANLEKMSRMSAQDFIDANWHIPPYHPWCRGLLVPVGKAPKLKPVIEAQTEQVINAPTAEEVQSTFEELNLKTTPELAQAWVTTVAKPPVVFLSEVLGKKMSDLTKAMMEVERQSKLSAIGITGFQWDKQYVKLAGRELFDEKVPWSLKLDFYDRKWELTRLMSEDPEFRALVMQQWGPYFDELGLMYAS